MNNAVAAEQERQTTAKARLFPGQRNAPATPKIAKMITSAGKTNRASPSPRPPLRATTINASTVNNAVATEQKKQTRAKARLMFDFGDMSYKFPEPQRRAFGHHSSCNPISIQHYADARTNSAEALQRAATSNLRLTTAGWRDDLLRASDVGEGGWSRTKWARGHEGFACGWHRADRRAGGARPRRTGLRAHHL